jgi:hypothetical protein
MDYPYFTAAPQPYQFLGLPPTPAHTGSANSDDFSNSPPDAFEFQNFDTFNAHFNAAAAANSGLPVAKPPTPLSQHKGSVSGSATQHNTYDINNGDMNDDSMRRGSNSDDDDNMTPAQSRRKAQNRAAQRAFRERKERHVKDLEAKLTALEKTTLTISEENERLKLQLQKASTENEILKATSAPSHHRSPTPLASHGPMRYSPTDFYTNVLYAHENKTPSHRIVTSDNGERLLAAGATWDYIIKHPLYVRGLVNVGDVSERLKKCAKCDGQGPVFEESAIVDAIEKSVASGSDELL